MRKNKAEAMRQFPTGATRNVDHDKIDPEGFISPLVIKKYSEYLHLHRKQADGKMRSSDNWQKGIPIDIYMKSLCRHHLEVWLHHREFGHKATESLEDSLCGVIFNAMGYLFEIEKRKLSEKSPNALSEYGHVR